MVSHDQSTLNGRILTRPNNPYLKKVDIFLNMSMRTCAKARLTMFKSILVGRGVVMGHSVY